MEETELQKIKINAEDLNLNMKKALGKKDEYLLSQS